MALNSYGPTLREVPDKAEPTSIGQRREPVFMHCGTILPRWIPKYWRKPPTDLRGDEEALTNWYNRRCGCQKLCRGGLGGIPAFVDESVTAGRLHELRPL